MYLAEILSPVLVLVVPVAVLVVLVAILLVLVVVVCVCVCACFGRAQQTTEKYNERERERENQPRRKKRRERERCATTADLWFNRVDVCDTIDHNNLQSNLCSLSAVRCPLLVLVLVRLLLCFCPYRPSSCPLSRSLLRFPVLFSLRLHDKTR